MLVHRHQVRVILHEARDIEFWGEHRSELDVAALERRAPKNRAGGAIHISRQSDADPANASKLHPGFADTGSDSLGYEISQLRSRKFKGFTRDIFGCEHVAGEIGERHHDLMRGDLNSRPMHVVRSQAQRDERSSPASDG